MRYPLFLCWIRQLKPRLYKPVLDWYKPIHIIDKSSKRGMARIGRDLEHYDNPRRRKVINLHTITKFGTSANIGGAYTKLYTIADICKCLRVSQLTVLSWVEKGFLPEPYTQVPALKNGVTRYWTYGQVYACVLVINDIYRQGAFGLRSQHARHIHLMRVGAARELEFELSNNLKRLQRKELPAMKEGGEYTPIEFKPKFGVEWEGDRFIRKDTPVPRLQDLMPQ